MDMVALTVPTMFMYTTIIMTIVSIAGQQRTEVPVLIVLRGSIVMGMAIGVSGVVQRSMATDVPTVRKGHTSISGGMAKPVILTDNHVHTGRFRNGLYFSPEKVAADMKALGVACWAFSSTSTGHVPFASVRDEIERTVEASGGSALPFLWVTPGMLKRSRNLSCYFFREFYGLKIHGLQGWEPNGAELRRVFSIAAERGLPVLLHTGEHPRCEAGVYLEICSAFPTVPVILAHGRPVQQTIDVMRKCLNAYTDTAFMPVKDILKLKQAGLLPHTLFGTDFPITQYFFKTPARAYYRRRLQAILKAIGNAAFRQIVWETPSRFLDCFSLNLSGKQMKAKCAEHGIGF